MKGRSQRLPRTEPPDDWVDGSWTVDCVCGVNFDDGEEMVNCDECGVWVHTRCSRFVKGETSFACDKCKSKKNRNDNEETEVAQLLVELPTKTMRMDNPHTPSAPPRPFRLWTDIPMEDRVHVQGLPGGDPTLFQGLSSVFTSELWKCTGYVPKRFNFQYREFHCWEENQGVNARSDEENESPVGRGANALFSLSKEIVSASPVEMLVGLRGSVEAVDCERKSSKEMKKQHGKESSVGRFQNGLKRERNRLRPFGVHVGKRRKDDMGGSKDHSGKNKSRSAENEADNKKSASTPAIDDQKMELLEDGGFKISMTHVQGMKNDDRRAVVLPDPISAGCFDEINNIDKPKDTLAAKAHHSVGFSRETSKKIPLSDTLVKSENGDHQVEMKPGRSPKTDAVAISLLEPNDFGSAPIKEEDVNKDVDGLHNLNDEKHDPGDFNGSSSSVVMEFQKLNPPVNDLSNISSEVQDNQMLQDSNGKMPPSSLQHHGKIKTEANDDQSRGNSNILSPPFSDVKLSTTRLLDQHPEISAAAAPSSEDILVPGPAVSTFPSGDIKDQGVDGELEAVSHCDRDNIAEGMISVTGEPCQYGQESNGSAGPVIAKESSSEPKNGLKHVEEPSKMGWMNSSSPAALTEQHKVVVGIGKSSTLSSTVITKSSASGTCKPPGRHASPNARPVQTKRGKVNSYADNKKDHTMSDVVKDNARHETSRKTTKEHPKISANSMSKTSHMGRISHASISKRTSSDSKEQLLYQSSRASVTRNVAASSGSVDTSNNSNLQNKTMAAGFSQKGDKFNQSSSQQSSKVNNSSYMNPAVPVNSSLTLSDEELALLLHQELNSSPRVPRVPRMRHAGSVPQLASPTATSMLIKCKSNPGGKDQILVSRRKNKDDAPKDGFRNSRELIDGTKQMGRLPSSPDQRKQGPIFSSDGSKKEAYSGSPELVHSAKNVPLGSTTTDVPSSSTEVIDQNISSVRSSDRVISDDDADAGSVPHTLPGLIDEIMSKDRHKTYEELCDAVLPHWHNLRKHNGERYAYSNHSLAVLDCLRNRNEWAQLVDRGPKTNAGRKRRKLDSEPTIVESEENEYGKGTASVVEGRTVESHPEDFPKGKRKARKRRRLTLRGRGVKEVRKRRKADVVTDDDLGSFSHSSEEGTESIFSEDESQGVRSGPIGSEASTSSDETGSVL